MNDEKLLSVLSTEAFERLEKYGNDPLRLQEPWKTISLIYSAQGVIGNGGFVYFFENDWPNHTPYDEFAAAYDRIGVTKAGEAIRSAVFAMGIVDPESKIDERRAYIEQNTIDGSGAIARWNEDALLDDEAVMASLAAWVRGQKLTE